MISEEGHLIDYLPMSTTQSSSPQLKCQRIEQSPEQSDISPLETESKRQKCEQSIDEVGTQRRPAAFWDNLSKIWLTKGALRELDRRNSESASQLSQTPSPKPHRPLTRQFVANMGKKYPVEDASDSSGSFKYEQLPGLKRFSSHGGPDLSDLRNFPQDTGQLPSRNKRPLSTAPSSSSKRSSRGGGTYSRCFEQHLIDHGIYPEGYKYPSGRKTEKPSNWAEINKRLSQPRASLSPSNFTDEEFENFKEANTYAANELPTTTLIPTIEGGTDDPKTVAGGYPFGNLRPLTDGTITCPWPDRFYGARPEQLHRKIRHELCNTIIPSAQDSRPMLPNFFLEVKGPDSSAAVAKRQACYDGALGARAMLSLESYGKDVPVYSNNAYTIASTYHDGTLKMYTCHPIEPTDFGHEPEYVMTQLGGWSMTGNPETFRQGATWYRNAREWARGKRDEFIMAANATLLRVESEQLSTSQEHKSASFDG
ncbi:hypothetical protein FQN54_002569 [Arachnomyces sp. PD_36]|nr:hypothetical protein FQN54_002569 [Arachnomyces sp. PD_36]